MELIPLNIQVRGEVIASNAEVFAAEVGVYLAEINRNPQTPEEFGEAENQAKFLKEAECAIANAKAAAMREAKALNAVFAQLDSTSSEIREVRLDLEKAVKGAKETIRENAIADALGRLEGVIPPAAKGFYRGRLESKAKGKRTLETIERALREEETIIRDDVARACAILDEFEVMHGATLITDRSELLVWRADSLEAELRRRLEVAEMAAKKEAAEKEAREARAEKTEEEKPQSPVAEQTEAEEWEAFKSTFLAALLPVRNVRRELKWPNNITRAQTLATEIGEAWGRANVKAEPRR